MPRLSRGYLALFSVLFASLFLLVIFKIPMTTIQAPRKSSNVLPETRLPTQGQAKPYLRQQMVHGRQTAHSIRDNRKRLQLIGSSMAELDPRTHVPQDGVKCNEWLSFVESKYSLLRSNSSVPSRQVTKTNPFCINHTGSYTVPSSKKICQSVVDLRFFKESEYRGVYLLFSYPGSGNTWVRLLIEELTGIFTGSVYYDKYIFGAGMMGEGVMSEEVIVVKSHQMKRLREFKVLVAIVRNPFYAILSFLAYQSTSVHTKGFTIAEVNPQRLTKFLNIWTETYTWLRQTNFTIRVVQYDKLVTDFETEIIQLASFLDYPIRQETIDCVVSANKNMTAFRRTSYQSVRKSPYSSSQEVQIYDAINSLKDVWMIYGVDYKSWHWKS